MSSTEHVFDKRIIERHIRKGTISRQDFEKHLDSLPDVGSNAEWVVVDDPLHPAEAPESV